MQDASKNGTLPTIQQETSFYKTYRDLYLHSDYLGWSRVSSRCQHLSFALWSGDGGSSVFVHVVNRNRRGDVLEPQKKVELELPLAEIPISADAVSPDWEGSVPVSCHMVGGRLKVSSKSLEAYSVIRLHFAGPVNLSSLRDDEEDGKNR
jgi:hypothetical protein